MKRFIIFLITLLVFSSVTFADSVTFNEEYNVPIDKENWTIELSKAVDESSVNSDTAYILDEFNIKVDTKLKVDGNKIIITPNDNYHYNTLYTIYVENIFSIEGEGLKSLVEMKFTTEKEVDRSKPKEILITGENSFEMGYPLFLDLEGYSYGSDSLTWDILKNAKWSISNDEIAYLNPVTKELWGYREGQVIVTVELGDLKANKTINILPLTVEEKANRIIEEIIRPGMTDFQKVLEIHDYVVRNTMYDLENKYDWSHREVLSYKEGPLLQGRAICGGYTEAFNYLLELVGIESIEVGGYKGEPHAWSMVKLNGEWYHVDTTADDATYSGLSYNCNRTRYVYFLVSDDKMKETHSWNEDNYPKANNRKYEHLSDIYVGVRNEDTIYASIEELHEHNRSMFEFKLDMNNGDVMVKEKIRNRIELIDSDGFNIIFLEISFGSNPIYILNYFDIDKSEMITFGNIDGMFIQDGWIYFYNDGWDSDTTGWYRIRLDGTDEHKI